MVNIGEELKDRLKRLRTEANLKIREVAKAIEISDQHVKDMEAGRRGIGTDVLLGYSRLFNLTMESILLGEGAIYRQQRPEPLSTFAAKLTMIPDEVWAKAIELADPKDKDAWDGVMAALEIAVEKKMSKLSTINQS